MTGSFKLSGINKKTWYQERSGGTFTSLYIFKRLITQKRHRYHDNSVDLFRYRSDREAFILTVTIRVRLPVALAQKIRENTGLAPYVADHKVAIINVSARSKKAHRPTLPLSWGDSVPLMWRHTLWYRPGSLFVPEDDLAANGDAISG